MFNSSKFRCNFDYILLDDGLIPPNVVNDAKTELEEGEEDTENGADAVKKTAAVETETSQVLDQNRVEEEKESG